MQNRKAGMVIAVELENRTVRFFLGNMLFEFDKEKNRKNIEKHGVSFTTAARIFFDDNRIEMYDEEHSIEEDRYNTIGDTSVGDPTAIRSPAALHDILFVVYTERETVSLKGKPIEITRLISARLATNFERGLYYGKLD